MQHKCDLYSFCYTTNNSWVCWVERRGVLLYLAPLIRVLYTHEGSWTNKGSCVLSSGARFI